MVVVTDKQLQALGTKTFVAVGVPADEAAWVTDCLVRSNLKGVDSHGVQQIPTYVKHVQSGAVKPGAKIRLLKETAATALFDGGGGFGYTMAREAMDVTMKKAREAGIAFSGIQNLGHIGRVGRWAEMALENGMIGAASQPGGIYIAPWGGIERKLPIAPIAVSIPTHNYPPIVIDMSLGPLAGGRASILALRKQRVPLGWLIDNEGRPTDDPAGFGRNEGAQLPLGQAGLGYKGMALALIEQILSGPLIGVFKGQGVFFQVIDIEAFTPLSDFKQEMDSIIANIKASKLAPGFPEILMPGEPEWREQEKRLKEGIFLDEAIYKGILDTAKAVGVDTEPYTGRTGEAQITHPSYTLKDRH
jgi:LDH2 family malate/lactate/ureidoglycolate dehydrogenase